VKHAAGPAYADRGLAFCDEIGGHIPSVQGTCHRRRAAADQAPRGRHTAASLAIEAGVDLKAVSDQLGHSAIAITADTYAHVRRAVQDANAEKIVALLSAHTAAKETGS